MVRRVLSAALLCAAALLTVARAGAAQIRPLDPLDACARDCDRAILAEFGTGLFEGQRASLAGEEGRLLELGQLRFVWRLDRVAFEAAGALWRRFEPRHSFAEPVGAITPRGARLRGDVGDFRVATIVTLGRSDHARAVLRFGSRLPTTDDGVGLERDRTDFFALVGGQLARGRLGIALESGLGIQGTRNADHDQVDVWLYSASVEYQWTEALAPGIVLVGQADGLRGASVRGNEDLRELRAGVRIGRGPWLRVVVVRGLADFSPGFGLVLTLGVVR